MVGTDGVVYGPVPVATLYEWIATGRVVPMTTLIDWQGRRLAAAALPELQGAFGPPPAQAPVALYDPTQKRKKTALLLAFFLGPFGAHRFYLGYRESAYAMLGLNLATFCVTSSLPAIVALVLVTTIWLVADMAMIASGSLREANGRPLA